MNIYLIMIALGAGLVIARLLLIIANRHDPLFRGSTADSTTRYLGIMGAFWIGYFGSTVWLS